MKKPSLRTHKRRGAPNQPENTPPRPHPLALNPNEGIWFNSIKGPLDGWFSFGEHGNPPFDTPVQVTIMSSGKRLCVGVGIRRRTLSLLEGKEEWDVTHAFGNERLGQLAYWRPLDAPYEPVKKGGSNV